MGVSMGVWGGFLRGLPLLVGSTPRMFARVSWPCSRMAYNKSWRPAALSWSRVGSRAPPTASGVLFRYIACADTRCSGCKYIYPPSKAISTRKGKYWSRTFLQPIYCRIWACTRVAIGVRVALAAGLRYRKRATAGVEVNFLRVLLSGFLGFPIHCWHLLLES